MQARAQIKQWIHERIEVHRANKECFTNCEAKFSLVFLQLLDFLSTCKIFVTTDVHLRKIARRQFTSHFTLVTILSSSRRPWQSAETA